MRRYLWIPVTGTVAALIVVLLTHAPRGDGSDGDSDYSPPVNEPSDRGDAGNGEADSTPPLEPGRYTLVLNEDGTFETDDGASFENTDAVLEKLAPTDKPRPRITLSNDSAKVTQETFNQAVEALSKRCDLTPRYYGGPDEKEDG